MITLTAAKKTLVQYFIITAVLFFISLYSFAQTPTLVFVPVVQTGLNAPADVVNAGDGTNRLFIAELGGQVKIVTLPSGTLQPGIFLDMTDSTDNVGENGLLSIAFHPDFENNRYLFVYYTNTAGNLRITRFQTYAANPSLVDQTTGTVIMTIPHPTNSNHNGGKLNFGPDGNLYLGTGDGGGGDDPPNNAQNGNSLLGKMIRINVDDFLTPPYYTIPADNPYVGVPGVREEIYNMGLRNPFRWSFDRLNGDIWIADVGQDQKEEVNYTPLATSAGLNYGWRCWEGLSSNILTGCGPSTDYFFPIFDYDRPLGHAITGGYVYRGPYNVLKGWYICVDYVFNNAWVVKPNGTGGSISSIQTAIPFNIVGFGEAESNGALYAVSINGTLYRIESSTPYLPLTLLQFTAKAFTAYNELKWKTTNEMDLSHYEIEYSTNGRDYTYTGKVNALNSSSENNYSFQHPAGTFNKMYYRLKTVEKNGNYTHSHLVWVDSKERTDVKVYPTLVTGNVLKIVSAKPVEQVTFFSAEGKHIFQTKLGNLSGTISVPIPRMQKGIYFVQLKLKDEYVYEKVVVRQD
ncbi:MAG TPA: PQQ-dependent sugar dehydrogenase [Ferruginibacter sp.]|nr:PQQ-dependent sugar dehydrogenase [Ferruginibacter sp.]